MSLRIQYEILGEFMRQRSYATLFCLICFFCTVPFATRAYAQGLSSRDLSRLRSVGSAMISPDGRYIAYTVITRDQPGRSSGHLGVMDRGAQ
jgi:hypothetical protein